jgi:hypothetical protein
MKRSSIAIALALACAAGTSLMVAAEQGNGNGNGNGPQSVPEMAGIHWARGDAHAARPNRSPNLTYHGGPVMHSTVVQPIFWGPSWNNTSFVGDKVNGLQTLYSGVGVSLYSQTNTEYTDASGHVDTATTLGNTVSDFSTVSATGQTTSPILAEVCAQIPNPVANGYYPVYTDRRRGNAGFCAWHSAGTCGNVTVQFAFFFNLDGDAGCDPQDTSGLHSQGLAALANVSGHEYSEMLTDRQLNAWFDSSGSENSDKCAWTFGTPLLPIGNTSFKIQGNWSNSAFNASSGYPNSGGQRGCLDGGNFK